MSAREKVPPKKFRPVKTPTVIQMEAVECGAAALGIVLGYYKRFVPLEELRIACGVASDGSRAYNILEAAKKYGLKTKAFKKKAENLHALKPPFIVFWNRDHFLVVEGFAKDHVKLNDPAVGRRTVSYEDFTSSYSDVVLLFEPGEDFKKGGSPPNALRSLSFRLSGQLGTFFYLALAQFCLLIPSLATSGFAQIFIDKILSEHRLDWKWGLVIVMALTLLLHAFLSFFQGKCLYRLNAFLSIRLSKQFFMHLLKLPLNFYQQRSSGDLSWRMQLNDELVQMITGSLARAALNILLMAVYATIMFYYSVVIALIAIAEAAANVAMLLWIGRARTDAMGRVVQSELQMVGYSVNGLQNIETIKSLGMESNFFSKWAGYNTNWLMSNQEFGTKNIYLNILSPFFRMLANASLFIVGAFLILRGDMTVGMLIGLQIIMHLFLSPLTELVGLGKVLQQIKIDLMRLDDTLDNPKDARFSKQKENYARQHIKLTGELHIQELSFGYNPTKPPIIRDFSLDLRPGKTVAIVGPSGCGKSTVAKLIAGLYHPWQGDILYDRKKHEEVPPLVMAHSLSIVDQDIMLFSGSIRDNLTLWNTTIPDSVLIEAAKDACIHEQIMLREGGYDSVLKEHGIDMSGGERQRMEIARALVAAPSLLILDEATSSLDAATEAQIMRNVKRRGSSCILIAHRLSTIRDADEILVLDKGKIMQRGTHHTLKEQPGLYRDLIQLEGREKS